MKLSLTKKNQAEGDYSGLDVINKQFHGVDLHESVFNGTYFTNVNFFKCDLRHTEFTEAKFDNCIFNDCILDYSDFVFLNAANVRFINCSFKHIEWRENSFTNLEFINCGFTNSTISLCSFTNAIFDSASSVKFCGATKRYNVFCRSSFELHEDNVEFLSVNYGFIHPSEDATIDLHSKNKKDDFLVLSAYKYFNQLDTYKFVNLVISIGNKLSSERQRNHVQKIKYLTRICKVEAEANTISVFATQLLVNSLNLSAKKISDSAIFMEVVDLIMFLKTHQYTTMKQVEAEVQSSLDEYAKDIICVCALSNTYKKQDAVKFVVQLCDFLQIPKTSVKIVSFKNGSTVIEFIVKASISIGGFLLFINFSLCQVHKTIDYLAKIKKNLKYLGKKDKKEESTESKALTVVPFAVMNNEGTIYYTQVNNVINIHGTDLVKMDGPGEIQITVKDAKAS